MSIFDYILKYGKYTFNEMNFNEVDNVIFASLSYLNLEGIVSKSAKNKISIGEIYKTLSKKKHTTEITAVRNAYELLKAISNKKRFKDICAYSYLYIGDDSQQFSALCFDINDDVVYVSFEGTDHLISGWEEDFKMGYEFPVLSQKHAIRYLNKNFTISSKKLIVGGHSKGGNLAMVGSMYCNFLVRNKIISIYSNDGPGLRKKQLESDNYKRIEDKLIKIIPNYSVVGLLLRHTDNYIVIKSTKRNLYAHAVVNWVVNENHFERSKLSDFSKIVDDGMIKWLDKYDDKQREDFVKCLFDIFRRSNVNSLIQIIDNKRVIFKLLREGSYTIDPLTKTMIKDFIYVILKYSKDYELEKIKGLF